jgi:ABC-type glycerol-3-phosphate transport system substrate-binding protein
MQRRTTLLGAATLAALSLVLTGCAPGAPAASGETTGAPSTDLGTADITLSLISTPESGAATKATIAAFEAKHPHVTVKYEQTNYEDYNKSVNLALNSDSSPDIVLLNSVGNTVKNKLVLNLDPYADLYKWDDVYPSTQLDQWRVAADGSTLGAGGALAAAPAGFSIVGLYYNKKLADTLGIEAPASLADLEGAMAKAKAAGVLPLQLGNAQGHSSFVVQLLGQSADGASEAAKWVFGEKGATFDTAGNKAATKTLADWEAKGYLPADANGVDLQGAVANFVKGEGLFLVDGNWDAATIGDALGADAGFVAFPGDQATGIGTSVAYAISSKSKHANAAAAFLNFLNGAEASKQQFAAGFMPVDPTAATPASGTVMADIVAAWGKVVASNGLVGFNNNATATMNDTLTAASQELLGKKISPAQFVSQVQDDWATVHGRR